MGYLLDAVNQWKQFSAVFGDLEEISSSEANEQDEHLIWTLWSRGSDFLANEFVVSDEAVAYFKATKTWKADKGTLTYVITEWVDCPTCEENSEDEDWDQDDCDECEGSGTLSISIPDCVGCETEDEVFAKRMA